MNITNRWTPTPRDDFAEVEYVRCDGLRVAFTHREWPRAAPGSEVALNGYTWTEGTLYAAECPEGEPLHRDKDGCPACSLPWDVDPTWAE